jgi:hypothetical protein
MGKIEHYDHCKGSSELLWHSPPEERCKRLSLRGGGVAAGTTLSICQDSAEKSVLAPGQTQAPSSPPSLVEIGLAGLVPPGARQVFCCTAAGTREEDLLLSAC